jgi:ATP-dependent helicase/nuclease subunit A
MGVGLSVCDETLRVRYPSLASTVVSDRLRRQMLAEEMRILYVATTRARERLILVGTCDPKSRDKWTDRWAGHRGPIPPDDVLSGSCMLDWLGPAASMLASAGDASIECTTHETVDVEELTKSRRPSLSPRQEQLAALQPLSSPPPDFDPQAQKLWDRLTHPYAHESFTKLAASASVTSLARQRSDAPVESKIRDTHNGFVFDQPLRLPRVGAEAMEPTAADIGTATHTLIEHLDLSRSCTVDDLREQLAALLGARLVSEVVASHLDLDAIAWFMTTDLAARLRKHAAHLRREIPINFPLPPEHFVVGATSADRMDRVMIRGRLDMLLPTPDGAILIDFKTDDLDAGDIDPRCDAYRPQLTLYRNALPSILGTAVAETWLVFLKPRALRHLQ